MHYLLVFFSALTVSVLTTPVVRRIANRTGFVDHPTTGGHKRHGRAVPLLGGVAVVAAMMVAVFGLGELAGIQRIAGVLAGAGLLAVVGMMDDRKGLTIRLRLVMQVLAATIMIATGFHVRLFDHLVPDAAITILWMVGVTNAMNFIDNMDGLSTGIAALASGFFLALSAVSGQYELGLLSAALAGASAGFLVFNFNPARIFLGDGGSTFIGFVLAAIGIQLAFPGNPKVITWMIPPLVLAVPMLDLALVVVSRKRRGVPVYSPGRDHLSHRLRDLGLSTRKTVLALYGAGIISGAAALALPFVSLPVAYGVGLSAAVVGLTAIWAVELRTHPDRAE